MKKLRLDVEALAVESFAAADEKAERGTVKAHGPYTYVCQTDEDGCSLIRSCGYTWCTCDNGQTCNWNC